MQEAKYQKLNIFIFKILAAVFMTFDHIGKCLVFFYDKNHLMDLNTVPGRLGYIFQIIGRLTLPLIAVCFAEAMRYTKSREDYMKRLGIMAMLIMIIEIIFQYALNMTWGSNIFITILCSAVFIYFFERKDNKKFICAIPVIFILLGTISCLMGNFNNNDFLPGFLKGDYNIYGFLLLIGFYYAYHLSDLRAESLSEQSGRTVEFIKTSPYYRTFTNLMWIVILVVINVFFWLLTYININFNIYDAGLQCFSMIASFLLFFYNGKKGYTSNKTKEAFYLYYPIHLVIIFVTFYLVFKI